MTRRLVSLPMYAPPATAQALFRERLAARLAGAGFAPAFVEPADLHAHWRSPDLLLSQTCGYPLRATLGAHLRLVATPLYEAPGCEGPLYRSAIVVRAGDPASGLGDLRGRVAAFNARDSQSGFNALRAAIAPLAQGGRFLAGAIETGSHDASIAAVLEGRADLAAIDAVTLALRRDRAPDLALRTLAFTDPAPALPFVTAAAATDREVEALAGALQGAAEDLGRAGQLGALRLRGFERLPLSRYDVILDQEAGALRQGYPDLA